MPNEIEVIDLSDDENVFEEQSQSTNQKSLMDDALLLQRVTESPVARILASSLTDGNASASVLNDSDTVPDSFVENAAGAEEPLKESEAQVLTAVTAEASKQQSFTYQYASTSMVKTTYSTLSGSSTAGHSNGDGHATVNGDSSPRKARPKSPSPEIVYAKVGTTPKKACPDEPENVVFLAEYSYQEDFAMWEPIDPLPPPHDDEGQQDTNENAMASKEPDMATVVFTGSSVANVHIELKRQEETPEDDSQQGTSNASSSPAKKRRRNKEEIEQEKLLKEVNRVRREMRTAKNSKCEQYLFCYINMNVRAMDDAIERELNDRFAERATSDQLVFTGEDMPIKVTWKRKCIDAYVEDGKLNRFQTMEPEGVYAIIIDADSFLHLSKSRGVVEFVQNSTKESGLLDAQPTVIVFGKHAVRENVLTDVLLDCHERVRCQFRFVNDARDLSYLIAQMHRALAKREKKLERAASSLPVINAEKGIREGHGLVRDWWTRMLSHMHRLSEEQKRALVERYPEPFSLMRRVSEMPAGEAMHEIANIVAGNGRRVGPVIAQKLYKVLTSYDGEDVLDNED